MKGIKKKVFLFITAFAMFATTGVGVFAAENVEGTNNDFDETPTIQGESLTKTAEGEIEGEGEGDTTGEAEPSEEETSENDAGDVEPLSDWNYNLKVAQSGRTAKISWNKQEAKTYKLEVDKINASGGTAEIIVVKDSVNSPCTLTESEMEWAAKTKYAFKLFEKGSGTTDPPATYGDDPVATKEITTPGNVTNLKKLSGYSEIVLKWKAVSGVDATSGTSVKGYRIYRYTSEAAAKKDKTGYHKGAKVIKPTTKYLKISNGVVTYHNKSVSASRTSKYWYRVYAVRDGIESPVGAKVNKAECVKLMYITLQPKANRTLTSHDKAKKTHVFKKGEKITAYGYGCGVYYFDHKIKGKTYKFRIARIASCKQKAYYIGKKGYNYTKEEAELFVNGYTKAKKVKSATKNLIWVSFYTQHMYIMKKNSAGKWELVKVNSSDKKKYGLKISGVSGYMNWESSTGKASTPSPTGNKKINEYRFRTLVGIPYWSCFSGQNGIHGKRPSYVLGEPHSHGCIRNDNNNAHWIYDKIKQNTRVINY